MPCVCLLQTGVNEGLQVLVELLPNKIVRAVLEDCCLFTECARVLSWILSVDR